jgi:hypothetical protein
MRPAPSPIHKRDFAVGQRGAHHEAASLAEHQHRTARGTSSRSSTSLRSTTPRGAVITE